MEPEKERQVYGSEQGKSPERGPTSDAPSERPVPAKVTVPSIRGRKGSGQKVLCLTAYDYPTARLADEAGFDLLLVGDSMANVVLGHASTLKISLEQMISATRAVKRGADRPLVVADMPFGSYQVSDQEAVRNAVRLVREGGAEAVKLEGGALRRYTVETIVEADIPVMGHVGLLPQSVHSRGGYRVQGKDGDGARQIVEDALALQESGAFAVVLEGVPAEVAAVVTDRLSIPTIGIGAGADCDGQILVFHDAVGLSFGPAPRFVKRYADVAAVLRTALGELAADMRSGAFPAEEHAYPAGPKLREGWELDLPSDTER